MENLLLGAQVTAIVSYIGSAFFLYRLWVKVFEERLKAAQERLDGAKEENARLARRIEEFQAQSLTPSDAVKRVELAEKAADLRTKQLHEEKDRLHKDLEQAKKDKNEAVEALTRKSLEEKERSTREIVQHKEQLQKAKEALEKISKESKSLELTGVSELLSIAKYKFPMGRRPAFDPFIMVSLEQCPHCKAFIEPEESGVSGTKKCPECEKTWQD